MVAKGLRKFVTQIAEELENVSNVDVENIRHLIRETKFTGGRIFLFGNGGSNAIAEHISTDLFKRCDFQTHTLSNVSLITCLSNDYSYSQLWHQYFKAFNIKEGDLFIFISSSGNSPNFLNAINHALELNCNIVTINGFGNKNVSIEVDVSIVLDSENYGVVELVTEIILHGIEERLVEEKEKNNG